jgi:UDP-N-acetylmuramate: L-alanyl-gamma-D-glutamyl-meso-diaminopimelate ligase
MNKHLHILGICGTAMAAIANLARELGWSVTGSDTGVYPPMSDYLAKLGIEIAPFDVGNLEPVPDLCVIGNAMSRGNVEVEAILNRALPYCSGPDFVGRYVLAGRHPIVVAGTHGKTTTSALLAHVLEVAGQSPGFLIGGVPENFGGGARLGSGQLFVLEGDEYDTAFFDKRSKFLHYQSRTLVLNNLEYDHADIFPDLEAIKTQFEHLIRTVPEAGAIIANADDEHVSDILARGCWTPVIYFAQKGMDSRLVAPSAPAGRGAGCPETQKGMDSRLVAPSAPAGRGAGCHETQKGGTEAQWHWQVTADDGSRFRLFQHGEQVMEISWNMIGIHNVANACAVAAATTSLGIELPVIERGMQGFAGVRRRMSLVGEARGVKVFDDFAHHPTAISGMVSAAKASMHGKGRLWVLVEPRSNTMRTRIHQQRLPFCFDAADFVVFASPSDRNLAADEVLDVGRVCQQIGAHASVMSDTDAIITFVSAGVKAGDHVLVLSNGGFENIHRRLLETIGL